MIKETSNNLPSIQTKTMENANVLSINLFSIKKNQTHTSTQLLMEFIFSKVISNKLLTETAEIQKNLSSAKSFREKLNDFSIF